MAPMIAYTLPAMQLVCNLVMPQVPGLTSNNFELINQNVSIVNGSLVLDHDASATSNPSVSILSPKMEMKTLPEGYRSFSEFGSAFKLHNETVTYPLANNRCVEEGGTLAVIDSQRKFDVLYDIISYYEFYYVGIARMYESREWVDIRTGLPLSTIPWAAGVPRGRNDYCATIGGGDHGLLSSMCSENIHFVCEIKIPQSHD